MKNPSQSFELCPKCHASIALTSYPSFVDEESLAKAFCIPTESQGTKFRNQILAALAEKATLEAAIGRFKVLLQNLEEHLGQLSTHISRTHTFVHPSPFRRLPTELLNIIFSYACADFATENHRTALRLSVVCSYWRTIVTNTPALWTSIFYCLDHRYSSNIADHHMDRCGPLLPLLLEITSPLPVFDAKNDGVDFQDIDVKVLIRLFCALRQWKIVSLRLTDFDNNSLVDNLRLRSAVRALVPEIMETLIVEKNNFIDSDYWLHFSSSFFSAPAFSSFVLARCKIYTTSNLPWERMCSLTFDEEYLDFLEHMQPFFANTMNKTLRICSKNLAGAFWKGPLELKCLVVQQLTTLVLEIGSRFSTLDKLLNALTVPDLQDVTLIYHTKDERPGQRNFALPIDPNDVVNALTSMIIRSKCILQSLTITLASAPLAVPVNDPFASAHVALLQQCPDLTTLRITEAATHEPLLLVEELSTACIGPDTILEELHTLELVWAEDHGPSSSFVSMLRSRSSRLSLSFVVLGIRNGGEHKQEVLDFLKELREQGVQASLW